MGKRRKRETRQTTSHMRQTHVSLLLENIFIEEYADGFFFEEEM
jgi:hypothetical protein